MIRPGDPYNAFLDYPQAAVSNAQSGPLAGLALAVKDIFDVAGYPSGWGNPQRVEEAEPAVRTAPAVQVLLDSGARFAGKTQTDELAFSLMGQNSHFPHPINPKSPGRITGGSSSGSAAAVAGGLADIATGSDTGGSIRAPASFCALIGLRTTHGAISLEGTMPLAPSFDTFGWFARDIETYRKVARVLLAASPLRGGWPIAKGDWSGRAPSTTPAHRKVGALPQVPHPAGPSTSSGPDTLPSRGRDRWRPLSIPDLDALVLPTAAEEYASIRNRVAAITGGPVAAPFPRHAIDDLYWCFRKLQAFEAWQSHGAWLEEKDRKLGIGVKERFDFARSVTARTAKSETLHRNDFRYELADLLGEDGVLILPTVPGPAPLADEPHDSLQAYREQALRLLCWSGLSGFPQLTLPLGMVDGAPFGISLLAPAGSDLALLELGADILAVEAA